MKKRLILTLVLVAALAALAGLALGLGRGGDYALAELSVGNLSCGSCVANIQKALAGTRGIGEVEVSVTLGRAKVQFEPGRMSAEAVAELVTKAGYPAAVARTLSPDDYRSLREDESRLAERFVGRIGERLVSRDDWAVLLGASGGGASRPEALRAAWEELLQRELLLASADRNGVVVQDGEVDRELEKMRAANSGFDAVLRTRYGGEENFRLRLKEEMIVRRNIEQHVLRDEFDSTLRQLKLDRWYSDLRAATPVAIFDPAVKAAVEGGGKGCGGKCCG